MKIILSAILFFISFVGVSQTKNDSVYTELINYNYNTIDSYIDTLKDAPKSGYYEDIIREHSLLITKTAKNDQEKVRAIYIWIVNNITYDSNKVGGYYRYAQAYIDRKAVCKGMAELFAVMCYYNNIKASYVVGYIPSSNDYHAWNFVSINGMVYKVDVTWRHFLNTVSYDNIIMKNIDINNDNYYHPLLNWNEYFTEERSGILDKNRFIDVNKYFCIEDGIYKLRDEYEYKYIFIYNPSSTVDY